VAAAAVRGLPRMPDQADCLFKPAPPVTHRHVFIGLSP